MNTVECAPDVTPEYAVDPNYRLTVKHVNVNPDAMGCEMGAGARISLDREGIRTPERRLKPKKTPKPTPAPTFAPTPAPTPAYYDPNAGLGGYDDGAGAGMDYDTGTDYYATAAPVPAPGMWASQFLGMGIGSQALLGVKS